MANDNLTLPYGIPVRVYVPGLNNSNVEKPVHDRTANSPTNLSIIPVSGEDGYYDITNISPTATGTFSDLRFFAKNELNSSVNSGWVTYTLSQADVATHLEARIV